MKQVYLAGPISGLTFAQAQGWRQDPDFLGLLHAVGWEPLNPLEGHSYPNKKVLSKWFEDEGDKLGTVEAVASDLNMIDRCDAVLVNLTHAAGVSIGTMVEIGYAHAHTKPIIAIMDKGKNDIHWHPFVAHLVYTIVPSMYDAALVLQKLSRDGVPRQLSLKF